MQTEREVLLIAKTLYQRLPDVQRVVKEKHPFDCPEVIAVAITGRLPQYLQFLISSCKAPQPAPVAGEQAEEAEKTRGLGKRGSHSEGGGALLSSCAADSATLSGEEGVSLSEGGEGGDTKDSPALLAGDSGEKS